MSPLDRGVVWIALFVTAAGVSYMLARGTFSVLAFVVGAIPVLPTAIGAYYLGYRHGYRDRQTQVQAVIDRVTRITGGEG